LAGAGEPGSWAAEQIHVLVNNYLTNLTIHTTMNIEFKFIKQIPKIILGLSLAVAFIGCGTSIRVCDIDGNPIENAKVFFYRFSLLENSYAGKTDDEGDLWIGEQFPGIENITVEKDGYIRRSIFVGNRSLIYVTLTPVNRNNQSTIDRLRQFQPENNN
jgi:hypothetical protein